MKKRDIKNSYKAKEQLHSQVLPKFVNLNKKEVNVKDNKQKLCSKTEELNVIMDKRKANRIMQYVKEKTEGVLEDIAEKLKVVKCLDSFYSKFYTDCIMKFKEDKNKINTTSDLLKNQKIVNKFDCCIIKIKELIDRKSNKEASNNLVVSYQNHSERIKEVEKKEAKYDMRKRCRSKSRAKNLLVPKKSPKKNIIVEKKKEKSKESSRETRKEERSSNKKAQYSATKGRKSDCFITKSHIAKSNTSKNSAVGASIRNKSRRK